MERGGRHRWSPRSPHTAPRWPARLDGTELCGATWDQTRCSLRSIAGRTSPVPGSGRVGCRQRGHDGRRPDATRTLGACYAAAPVLHALASTCMQVCAPALMYRGLPAMPGPALVQRRWTRFADNVAWHNLQLPRALQSALAVPLRPTPKPQCCSAPKWLCVGGQRPAESGAGHLAGAQTTPFLRPHTLTPGQQGDAAMHRCSTPSLTATPARCTAILRPCASLQGVPQQQHEVASW